LRKHGAQFLINTDGCCSLRTGIPQCLLVNDLEFLDHPQGMKSSIARYYQKNMQSFLEKSSSIATGSVYIKSKLVENYEAGTSMIELIRPGLDEQFRPFDWDQKEKIKERYADGRSYFLCSASVGTGNLVNLLKAFTLFKKRQKSSMLLLIAGKSDASFKKEFKTYRLREEVKILEDLSSSELAHVTAAAYAFVHPVRYANIALPVVQAMRCEVPVITSSIDPLMTEYAGSALFADPGDPKGIAENMMLLYKDEDLAKKLVGAGTEFASLFDAGTMAEKLMKCINSAFST
jgi:glycosyltransferase involved in cell wall biosynthesis